MLQEKDLIFPPGTRLEVKSHLFEPVSMNNPANTSQAGYLDHEVLIIKGVKYQNLNPSKIQGCFRDYLSRNTFNIFNTWNFSNNWHSHSAEL